MAISRSQVTTMADKFFTLEKAHIDIEDPSRIIFWGFSHGEENSDLKFRANINGRIANVELLDSNDPLFEKIFDEVSFNKIAGFIRIPELNPDELTLHLELYAISAEREELLTDQRYHIKGKPLGLCYSIDSLQESLDHSIQIVGWAIDRIPVKIRCVAADNSNLEIKKYARPDVLLDFPERIDRNNIVGFSVTIKGDATGKFPYKLYIKGADATLCRTITRRTITKEQWKKDGGALKYIARTYEVAKTDGVKQVIHKAVHKLQQHDVGGSNSSIDYQNWIVRTEPTSKDLRQQKNYIKEIKEKGENDLPVFSIVVPVYKTPDKYLKALIRSIEEQTYPNWELILADAGVDKKGVSVNTSLISRMARQDNRIVYLPLGTNGGIAENTNEAIKKATGQWIVFADHDDTLSKDALFQAFKVINAHPDVAYIYSDEDKIDASGRKRFDPNFKPDFNPDLLDSMNYISHLSVVKRTLIDEVGLLDGRFNGSQDYDLTLRCIDHISSEQIYHISEVLYHWRSYELSTAGNQESKRYAFEAGKRAVQAHLDRQSIPATAEETKWLGRYRVRYHWNERPLISVVIPNKDHVDDLKRCLTSITEKTTYSNYEIIIIENNSTEQRTEEYYKEISKNSRIKVVRFQGEFNYSAINNYGISFANGDYYLLLNNDTEVINPDWMTEMLDICMRKDVGIVGAKLYYHDGTIQHAGVIVGIGGVAGHAFKYFPGDSEGYFSRAVVVQDYSAVTAACMLVKKEAFQKVEGLSEDLAVAFNDVDFCLKVGHAGYRIVFTPYAQLYHYESKSRGVEDTPQKKARFQQEATTFRHKWGSFLESGDPCYNKHLSLKREDFSFNEEL